MCPIPRNWIKIKMKIREVTSGGLRVTSNQERFVVPAKSRSREGAFLPQRRRGRGGVFVNVKVNENLGGEWRIYLGFS
jgi:hypothetical protein